MTHETTACSLTGSADAKTNVVNGKQSPARVHRVAASNQEEPPCVENALTLAELVEAVEMQLKDDSKTSLNKRTIFRSLLE
jgi:hypothetical protein